MGRCLLFCLFALERTIVGIFEEEFALAVNHQDGCVDEKLSSGASGPHWGDGLMGEISIWSQRRLQGE